eukprot:TRINITY_DN2730_c0_g1_i1.p1 TRINITY_DN2730_c0_g1~~TRINITY_DN2730_c0_g1_i1.p1  ORF type:complete len:212 (-),score=63.59 TRINITY_DN2730_c0_g1_i1:44-679(-)
MYRLYDHRDMENPIVNRGQIDHGSGVIMPFYDADTNILFFAGKGDGNVRYYEITPEAKKLVNEISAFQSNQPTAGAGFMPKRGCSVSDVEIARIYRVTDKYLQPLKFCVPRKTSEIFADDVYVDAVSDEPGCGAEEWFNGANPEYNRVSLEHGFVAREAPAAVEFVQAEEDTGPSSLAEYKSAYEELTNRVDYLQAELDKANAKLASAGLN